MSLGNGASLGFIDNDPRKVPRIRVLRIKGEYGARREKVVRFPQIKRIIR